MAGGDTYVIIYLKMQLKAMKTDGVLTWKGYEDDFVVELAGDLDEEPDDVRVTLAYLLSCGLAETEDKTNFFLPYAVENTGSETSAAERMRNMRKRNSVTPMLQDRYGEKEIEKEIDTKDIERDRRRFTPPTIEEVKAYCKERGNSVNPERFIDYYTANGWKVGKNPMKDWKAAVRTWEKDDRKKTTMPGMYRPTGNDDLDLAMKKLGLE